MIDEQILVKNGKFISSENIIENDDCWEFINNDPQIYIRFNESIKGMRLKFDGINAILIAYKSGSKITTANTIFATTRKTVLLLLFASAFVFILFFNSNNSSVVIRPSTGIAILSI